MYTIETKRLSNGRLCTTPKKINLERQLEYDERQPWEDLANGIIKQAADDYKQALKDIKKTLKEGWEFKIIIMHAQKIHTLNRWFRGDWFSMLTQVDPKYLIENLNKYYGNTETTEFINRTAIYDKERI